jgi:methylenetetrahydrofolate--tRNA-(uracil-5-)-methyltransferase
MHRNTYLESPKILNAGYQSKAYPNLFFAGQISGVEGYVESAASGLNAAMQMTFWLKEKTIKPLPQETMMGAMAYYISQENQSFVPMNANWGLMPALPFKHKKKSRKAHYAERALDALKTYMEV